MKQELEKKLGVKISNIELFHQAFTHRSAVNEDKNIENHNERLEFLGDAVLELVVTEYLFTSYPKLKEGVLTNLRASLVKGDTLAEVARDMSLGDFLKVSKGEEMFGGREKNSLLANTVEAVLGALYLDTGYETVKKVLEKYLLPRLKGIIERSEHIDAKSHFQQLAQSQLKVTPHYKELSSSGPDHDKTFEIAVYVGEKQYGVGVGSSKQAGQQEAAKDALKNMGVELDSLS